MSYAVFHVKYYINTYYKYRYRFTHLQHQKFTYNITIDNNTGQPVKGTCRIFMSPTCDERGTEILFRDRRKLVIEMDKFVVTRKCNL